MLLTFNLLGAGCAGAVPLKARIDVDLEGSRADAPPPLFGYGGGVWHIPRTFPWVKDQIMKLPLQGTYRAALAWEVLATSKDVKDLEARLRDYRLNDFLQQLQARGARIIITLDAMPRWLAKEKSDKKLADGPAWAKSPPASAQGWADVMQRVVKHFNGSLGLDAWYEVWNEPDWSWHGTLDEYFYFYNATVRGALAADKKAKIGGPAISDWSATGSAKSKRRFGKGFFIQKWLEYCSTTPVPEHNLKRLPVDFITWHGFYREPASHYNRVVPQMRSWLQEAGYSRGTPLVVDEWNIAAEPPYPEGDLNGNYVGAAFVASSLISMYEAGLDRQVFQMMVDPGAVGYSAGTFTGFGLQRPNFQVFKLFSRLKGQHIESRADHKWLSSVAYATSDKLYLLVASFVPTPYMRLRAQYEPLALQRPELLNSLQHVRPEVLLKYYSNGEMPAGVEDGSAKKFLSSSRLAMQEFNIARAQWKDGTELTINILGQQANTCEVRRYRIDKDHTVAPSSFDAAHKKLQDHAASSLQKVLKGLASRKVAKAERDRFKHDMKRSFDLVGRVVVGTELTEARDEVHRSYGRKLDQEQRKIGAEQIAVETFRSAAGKVKVRIAPYAVELFEFCLK